MGNKSVREILEEKGIIIKGPILQLYKSLNPQGIEVGLEIEIDGKKAYFMDVVPKEDLKKRGIAIITKSEKPNLPS